MTMERGSLLNKRYRIVEILGQGGMAAVYRAIDENLGVEVAVKENLFTTEEYARQFRLEATILANMRHPNLPRVTDHFVIEQQGQYLVMDYIEGEDLRQRMDRLGALPEQEVIVIGVALCDALTYMHTRRPMVLHRDIKPGNVRITPHGHIYLVDFGLAKVVQGREATSTGARAMTPGYSPPEQYGTARTDHRSDIYSLGATLFSALTDALPEDGLARAMEQADLTPLVTHNPKVTRRLAAVLEKCLEVRPDNRYQSAEELKTELFNAQSTTRRKLPIDLVLPPPPVVLGQAISNGSDDMLDDDGEMRLDDSGDDLLFNDNSAARPPSRPKKKHFGGLGVFFTILMLLLAAGVAAYLINPNLPTQALTWMGLATPAPTREPAPTLPAAALVSETPIALVDPTQTPAPTATQTPSPTTVPTATATATASPVPTPIGGGALGQIAFASDRSGSPDIYLVNLDGTNLQRLTNVAEGACQPDWSPDGQRIVFISPCKKNQEVYYGSVMFIANADGSNVLPLPSVPGGDYDPVWSPDGKYIAFTSLRLNNQPNIYILNLEDNSVVSLAEPDGRPNSQPHWSPDGQHLVYINSDGRVWVMDVDGSNRRRLTIGEGDASSNDPVWSLDGQTILFTRLQASGVTLLLAVPYTTEAVVPSYISDVTMLAELSFSPDGYWLTYRSWATGNHDLFIMRPNGVDARPVVIEETAYDFDPAWRP